MINNKSFKEYTPKYSYQEYVNFMNIPFIFKGFLHTKDSQDNTFYLLSIVTKENFYDFKGSCIEECIDQAVNQHLNSGENMK